MRKLLKYVFSIFFIGVILITLSGCDKQKEGGNKNRNNNENNIAGEVETFSNEVENKNSETTSNSIVVKDGLYDMVLRAEDVELSAGDICLEITGNMITIGDGFAGAAEQGTYEVRGNKIVGYYTKITYIDHSNGGNMTEESISEEFDFDILEDGSLRDNYGYGLKSGQKNFQGRIYRLVEEY